MRPEPTGRLTVVGVDDLFFSTTDRRGVIQGANSVFSRFAGYSRDELLGAAHNIVRHPEMPGGVFTLMWDHLLSGRSTGAYVKNLAKDGSSYWVFATVVPLGDTFLSVRATPSSRPLWRAVVDLYGDALPLERTARAEGRRRHEAAATGAAALVEGVRALGYPSYDAFVRAALPLEVTARAARSGLSARRPGATGDLALLLRHVDSVDSELSLLLSRLDGYQQLATALSAASTDVTGTVASLRDATESAARASETVVTSAPVLARVAGAMAVRCREAVETVDALCARLAEVREWFLELRFRISLARLHDDMVMAFGLEVLDGREPPERLHDVAPLCAALHEGVEVLARDLSLVASTLGDVVEDVERVSQVLQDLQHLIATWRLLVPRQQLSRELGPYVAPIDAQLLEGHRQMASLRALAARCAAEAVPFDPERLRGPVAQIDLVSRSIARGRH